MNTVIKKRRGFLIIEMLCALTLFSMLCMILFRGYHQLVVCQLRTMHFHQAWSLARTVVEKCRINQWPLGNSTCDIYTIDVVLHPYQSPLIKDFAMLEVTITWHEKKDANPYQVTLRAGMITS